jgi:hypothetical protein
MSVGLSAQQKQGGQLPPQPEPKPSQPVPPPPNSPYSAGVGRTPTAPLANPAVSREVNVTPSPTSIPPPPAEEVNPQTKKSNPSEVQVIEQDFTNLFMSWPKPKTLSGLPSVPTLVERNPIESAELIGAGASFVLGPEVGVPTSTLVLGGVSMVGITAAVNRAQQALYGAPKVEHTSIIGEKIYLPSKPALTPNEAVESFALGVTFTGASSAALKGLALATGGEQSIFAARGMQSVLARSAFMGGISGGIGYAFTRNPLVAAESAGVGAVFAGGADLLLGGMAKTTLTPENTEVTPPTKQADLSLYAGGKSTGILSENFETDVTEASRQTEINIKTVSTKDQDFINWLEEFQKGFTPKEIELEGQGSRSVYNTKMFEGELDTAVSPINEGARGLRIEALDTQDMLDTLSGQAKEYVQRLEAVGKESTLIANKGEVSESAVKIGTNENPSDLTSRVTVDRNIYNSGRVLGEMDSETVAKLSKVLPSLDLGEEGDNLFKPFYKPSQSGGLSFQQLVNLPKTLPELEEVPVSTDIMNVSIREIPQMEIVTPETSMSASLFAGLLTAPKILALTTPTQVLGVSPKLTQAQAQTPQTVLKTQQTTSTEQTTKQNQTETTTEEPFTLYPTTPELSFPFTTPGFQFNLGGYSFTPHRKTGLLTQRNVFPILTAKEFLGYPTPPKNKPLLKQTPKQRGMIIIETPLRPQKKRRKKQFGDLL